MNWLIIALAAYLLMAVAVTIDKLLLTKKIENPLVYAFIISALGLVALFLIPFGFEFGSFNQIAPAILAGGIFMFALVFLFKALNQNEASRVTPFVGGLQPIFVLILAWTFLNEQLGLEQLIALVMIIMGTIVISWEKENTKLTSYLFAFGAALGFAFYYTLIKYVFLNQDFISGFIWSRIGAFIFAFTLLIIKNTRKDLKKTWRQPKKNTGPLLLFGQINGALGFILLNYAVAISPSVAIINALQGVQYAFVVIIILILSQKFPKILTEKFTPLIFTQKILAIIILAIGIFLLSYYQ